MLRCFSIKESYMASSSSLAKDYYVRAVKRLRVLDVLTEEQSYCDVVREAQGVVELLLKGVLRLYGIDPPKWHDVGPIIEQHGSSFSAEIVAAIPEIVVLSRKLRKEREISFYGDVDLIPSDSYTKEDADYAANKARWLVALLRKEFERDSSE